MRLNSGWHFASPDPKGITIQNASLETSSTAADAVVLFAALNYFELGASSLRCRCGSLGKSHRPIHQIGDRHQVITGTREDHWVPKQHHWRVSPTERRAGLLSSSWCEVIGSKHVSWSGGLRAQCCGGPAMGASFEPMMGSLLSWTAAAAVAPRGCRRRERASIQPTPVLLDRRAPCHQMAANFPRLALFVKSSHGL